MSIDKDILLNSYIAFDKPVPYKDWEIHPIKLIDWNDVGIIIASLETDKNSLGQIELIQMNNLTFFLLLFAEEPDYQMRFERLLRLALNISDDEVIQMLVKEHEAVLKIGEPLTALNGNVIINNATMRIIDDEDFNEIRRIILFQNLLDYTDEYVDPDVRKAVDDYYRLKNQGAKHISLEHKINCVQFKTGMTREQIGNLTARNFQQLFDLIVEESDYAASRIAEANGAKFKQSLEHWALREKTNKYVEAFCDADNFTGYVQSAN